MSDVMRWRYGDTNPAVVPAAADTAIEIGDLIFMDTGEAKPASSVDDQSTEAANQEYFHDRFVGVAMQRSPVGESRPIRVATSGVFQFACPVGTFEVGELLGASEQPSGTALEDQTVERVTAANRALGRCARHVPAADTSILIDIVSTLMRGGPQSAE